MRSTKFSWQVQRSLRQIASRDRLQWQTVIEVLRAYIDTDEKPLFKMRYEILSGCADGNLALHRGSIGTETDISSGLVFVRAKPIEFLALS